MLARDKRTVQENVELGGGDVLRVGQKDFTAEVVETPVLLARCQAIVDCPGARDDFAPFDSYHAGNFVLWGTSCSEVGHDFRDVAPSWTADRHLEEENKIIGDVDAKGEFTYVGGGAEGMKLLCEVRNSNA